MTRYDKLIDSIKDHLHQYYVSGCQHDGWDEADADEAAHAILMMVEEYQSSPLARTWRASD